MLMLLMVTLFAGRGLIGTLEAGAIGLMTTGAGEGAVLTLLLTGEVGAAWAGEDATPGVVRPARLKLSSLYSCLFTRSCLLCA